MKVINPFASLQSEHTHEYAVAAAMQSNAAEYIRWQILDYLVDAEAEPEHPFARGYRMGLRVAFLAAGGQCDGSEQDWARLVEEHRAG